MKAPESVYTDRIGAEVEAKAEEWRCRDQEITQLEHEIDQAWVEIAPSEAASENELPLDQAEKLSMINPNVPIESRLGVRRIKWLIRKLTYWYMRYLTDQFNAFAGMLIRHERQQEERMGHLENAIRISVENSDFNGSDLLDDPPEPSLQIALEVANRVGPGQCLVLSGGAGTIVESIGDIGNSVYGVEQNPHRVLAGISRRQDIRSGDIVAHLISVEEGTLGSIVLNGIVETLPLKTLVQLIDYVDKALDKTGRIVVAVADPVNREHIESELRAGLGIAPTTWRLLLENAGFDARLEPSSDSRITELVVAERLKKDTPASISQPPSYRGSKTKDGNKRYCSVDLLIPELSTGDATSNHTRLMRELLEEKGIRVRIVVERKRPTDRDVITTNEWNMDADVSILQHSIGSTIAHLIIQNRVPIVLNYHNITPARFFTVWHPELAKSVEMGRQQLHLLAPLTRRAIADSEYNAQELKEVGIRDVVVSPVLWKLAVRENQDVLNTATIPEDSGTMLFVGRIAPNKCHHDLISALAVLSRTRPKSRLILVGDASPIQYLVSLENLARQLGVINQIYFAGKLSDKDLFYCYNVSDIFVCVSEHEGFGVPLVEAMANGLPVVAYGAAAVTETVKGAGIVLKDKRPVTLASALNQVLGDGQLRRDLCDRGFRSAQRFDISLTREQMWTALQDLIEVGA